MNFDRATVRLDDGPGNGQAQTGAAVRTRGVHAIKPIENMWQDVGSDARAGVSHDQYRESIIRACSDSDVAVGFVMVDSVAKQVGDDLAEPLWISHALRRSKLALDL